MLAHCCSPLLRSAVGVVSPWDGVGGEKYSAGHVLDESSSWSGSVCVGGVCDGGVAVVGLVDGV